MLNYDFYLQLELFKTEFKFIKKHMFGIEKKQKLQLNFLLKMANYYEKEHKYLREEQKKKIMQLKNRVYKYLETL